MNDRATSTILISHGADQVMTLEGLLSLTSSLFPILHPSLNVSKPGRQWGEERWAKLCSLLGEAIENLHGDTLPPFRLMSF